MFKIIYIAIMIVLLSATLGAQTEQWTWVQTAGTAEDETNTSLAVDALGNSYVTGTFIGSLTLGTTTLTSLGDSDIYIAKADPEGNWLWATRAGSFDAEIINAITVDEQANVLITGCYFSTATFGTISLTALGNYDLFIAKLDSSGNWLWATSGGGVNFDEGRDIVTDASGNVYVTGSVLGNGVFGSQLFTGYGGADVLIAKANSSGVWQWCVNAGSDGADYGMGLYLHGTSDLYVTGSFAGVGNFGPTSVDSAGYHDVFVCRYDTDGTFEWIRRAGGSFEDWGHHVVVDADDNVYVVGLFRVSAGFGSQFLDSISGAYSEVFVAKINNQGTWSWARQAGGYDIILASDIGMDEQGNLLMTGYFRNQALFGDIIYPSAGAMDAFLAKYSPTGECLHALTLGGTGNDRGMGLGINQSAVYVSGSFTGNVSFGDIPLNSAGAGDVFVAKLVGFVPVTDEVEATPPAFAILSNYPNPFTQNTCIAIDVKTSGEESNLDIYDLRGRLVNKLHAGNLPTGRHDFVWDGRDSQGNQLPSGLYFCALRFGSNSLIRKIILSK